MRSRDDTRVMVPQCGQHYLISPDYAGTGKLFFLVRFEVITAAKMSCVDLLGGNALSVCGLVDVVLKKEAVCSYEALVSSLPSPRGVATQKTNISFVFFVSSRSSPSVRSEDF